VLAGARVLIQGTPADLVKPLDGRVWHGPVEACSSNILVLSRGLSGGRRIARVLADARPGPRFEPVSATLEDAYFAALANVEEITR
jgi:hypothetical protein